MSVLIHGLPAARWAPSGDTSGCGVFLGDIKLLATRTVFIGGAPSSGGGGAPRQPPSAAIAADLGLAAACRSNDGSVDEAGFRNFVERTPKLDSSGPGGLQAALAKLAKETLGREDVTLKPVASGAGTGQSGASVFLVHDESKQLVAVAKIFPQAQEMVRELSAMERLSADKFTSFRTPQPLGVSTAETSHGTSGSAPYVCGAVARRWRSCMRPQKARAGKYYDL
jgi:hypothetical protein